jgi:hypothetical protein
MKKIAFVTCLTRPAIAPDDRPLAEELAKAGYPVVASPWDDPGIDWSSYAAIVIRSTWNYHTRIEKFKAWLSFLKVNKLRVFNPVEILEWNMDKRYLSGLQAIGIPMPELFYFGTGMQADLEELFRATGWKKAVIKPCISAIAFNTWITTPRLEEDTQRLNSLLQEGEYIVQEFMDEVVSHGEYSLIFLNGQYSHAVQKNVAPGDFRVQEQFGGVSITIQPDEYIIRQAHQVMDAMKQPDLLYARVDGVIRNKVFVLMELELAEPSLFFNNNPAAIKKFTGALLQKMNDRNGC